MGNALIHYPKLEWQSTEPNLRGLSTAIFSWICTLHGQGLLGSVRRGPCGRITSSQGSGWQGDSVPGSTWGGDGNQKKVPEMVTVCKKRVLSCFIHRGKENISCKPNLFLWVIHLCIAAPYVSLALVSWLRANARTVFFVYLIRAQRVSCNWCFCVLSLHNVLIWKLI